MSHDEVLTVIAVNGLTIKLDASVRYQLVPEEVVALHEEIGPEYYEKILEPVLRSEARRVIGQYTPEEIYSTKRDVIEREIREGVSKIEGSHLSARGDPDPRRRASGRHPHGDRSEARRRAGGAEDEVRARGGEGPGRADSRSRRKAIADYNRIVAASLSPQVLEFERIQQLRQLAESPNSKTVVLGPGTGNQSLLVGSAPAPTAPAVAPRRAPPSPPPVTSATATPAASN